MTLSILMSMPRSGITRRAGTVAWGCCSCAPCRRGGEGGVSFGRHRVRGGVDRLGGVDALAARFTTWQDESLVGRVGVWRDARMVLQQFPVTGTGLNTLASRCCSSQSSHLHELMPKLTTTTCSWPQKAACVASAGAWAPRCDRRGVRRRLLEPGNPLAQWIGLAQQDGSSRWRSDLGDFSLQIPGTAALFCASGGVTGALQESQVAEHVLVQRFASASTWMGCSRISMRRCPRAGAISSRITSRARAARRYDPRLWPREFVENFRTTLDEVGRAASRLALSAAAAGRTSS